MSEMKMTKSEAVAVLEWCGFKDLDAKPCDALQAKFDFFLDILPDQPAQRGNPPEGLKDKVDQWEAHAKTGGTFAVVPDAASVAPAPPAPVAVETPTEAPAALEAAGAEESASAEPVAADATPDAPAAEPKKRGRPKKDRSQDPPKEPKPPKAEKPPKPPKAEKPPKPPKEPKPPKAAKEPKPRATRERNVRTGTSACYIAGRVLQEFGWDTAINAEMLARYEKLRGGRVLACDKWYLKAAQDGIRGYFDKSPLQPAPVVAAAAEEPVVAESAVV